MPSRTGGGPADRVDWSAPRVEALALLKDLLAIDTSNPPGCEAPAAERVAEALRADGLEPRVIESAPRRVSVVVRLRGSGERAPLLLASHLDVVPPGDGRWTHPPFAAVEASGYVWGRGAVDMKNMVAMSAMVIKLLAREKRALSRDVIAAFVADEEAGCDLGSKFLVDHHPDLVRAETMLGEVGGFSYDLFGRRLYPIQVAEKGICWLKLTARGTAGHGSTPREDAALVRLARAIGALGTTQLPIHRTAAVDAFLAHLGACLPAPQRWVFPLVAHPVLGRWLLARLRDRTLARNLWAMLSSTANPTMLSAGEKVNVVPGTAFAEVDGRTLPGQGREEFVDEVRAVAGAGVEIDVTRWAPAVETSPTGPAWEAIDRTVRRLDPAGVPVPYLCPGFTDAKAFSTLGTRCLGFAPVRFEPGDPTTFGSLFHAVDERVPVEGFVWGLSALYEVVCRLAAAGPDATPDRRRP
jgi:acetylornithine deacetylase/succinyl-diaminopimelate desuccinylase-like protein